MKVASITATGKESLVTVSDALFGAPVNKVLLAQAIRVYLSNARQGTSKVKTRSEVNLTKRKMYKQKGTGNARHGAQSAPIFVGGGVAHGPKGIENWNLSLSRTMKLKALICALSAQAKSVKVCAELTSLTGKTKEAVKLLASELGNKKVLIVLADRNELVERSIANIPNVLLSTAALVNAHDISAVASIIFEPKALELLEVRLAAQTKKKTSKE